MLLIFNMNIGFFYIYADTHTGPFSPTAIHLL